MKAKKRRVPVGMIWLILTLLVIAGAVFFYVYRYARVMADFSPRVFEDEPSFRTRGSFLRFLEEQNVDLSVPGTGGQTLTFQSPTTFSYTKYGVEEKVRRGTEISCDFVSWSGNKLNERFLGLTVDGKDVDTYVSLGTAGKLYRAALEQNGLEDQFLADTGEALSRGSAREALRTIDRQIYDGGIYMPVDYPYDRCLFRSLMMLMAGCLPLVLLALLAIVPALVEYTQYQLWLADYNRESSRRWKNVEGTLPQFVSLRDNGGGGKPQPIYQPPSLWQRIKGLFSPVSK